MLLLARLRAPPEPPRLSPAIAKSVEQGTTSDVMPTGA